MALDATIGGSSSNSYVTQAEATAYFGDRIYSSGWTNASSDTKDDALVTATGRIDQEIFIGYIASNTQALRWPRYWAQTPFEPYGRYYTGTEIPQPIKDAVCELALTFINAGVDLLAPTGMENFKEVTVGPIHVVLNQPVSSGFLPNQVSRLLSGFLVGGGMATLVRA